MVDDTLPVPEEREIESLSPEARREHALTLRGRVLEAHLDALANIARLMSDDEFRFLAREAKSAADIRRAIEARFGGEAAVAKHAAVGEVVLFC